MCLVAGLIACADFSVPEEETDLDLAAGSDPVEPSETSRTVVNDAPNTQIAVIPVRKPQTTPLDPEALIGSNETEVTESLGEPNGIRTEVPATIWSYGDRDCGLDLYYYLDVSGNSLRVLNYRIITAEESEVLRRDCLRQLNQGT